ncbi:MAG: hypothetical protein O7H41_15125 [Planctomycetota bacterium]|nr:hypothetical protein [Planctomycetota bacterium]
MEFHPSADLFPMMNKDELRAMVLDIKAHGLLQSIVTYKGKILDGRNRFQACKEAKVGPRFEKWNGEGSPTSFVISCNLQRRQLTQSQVAAIAVDSLPLFEEEARSRLTTSTGGAEPRPRAKLPKAEGNSKKAVSGDLGPGRARDFAAQTFGVSGRYVEDAKALKATDPGLFGLVKAGELTISAARNLIANPMILSWVKDGKITASKAQEMLHLIKSGNENFEKARSSLVASLQEMAQAGRSLHRLMATLPAKVKGKVSSEGQVAMELSTREHLISDDAFIDLVSEETEERLLRLGSGEISKTYFLGVKAALAKTKDAA